MADPYENPLSVQPPQFQQLTNPTPEQQSDLSGQWRNWMANEGNRAALLQLGVSLMQPMDFGQTPVGHIGQAIGSVGELGSRREAQQLKEREVSSKEELRASQAGLAEARAGTAGVGAARQADRLAFLMQQHQDRMQLAGQGQRLKALQDYGRQQAAHNREQILLPAAQRSAFPDIGTWAARNGISDVLGETTGQTGPETPIPPAAGASASTASASGGQALPPLASRVPGQTRINRNGQSYRWETQGWVPE